MKQTIALLFCVSLFACKKENVDDPVYFQRMVTKVEGTFNGTISQPVDITVYWPYSNGCDVLEKFTKSQQGNIISIKAFGYTKAGLCTQDAGIKTKMFSFKSAIPGVFELRFYNPDNSFVTHTITIN
jgi:hypothetical protein